LWKTQKYARIQKYFLFGRPTSYQLSRLVRNSQNIKGKPN
jgi:hypothetical protein